MDNLVLGNKNVLALEFKVKSSSSNSSLKIMDWWILPRLG